MSLSTAIRFAKVKLFCAQLAVAAIVLAGTSVRAEVGVHKEITRRLIKLTETRPEIKRMLSDSIAGAKQINPDPKTNPVQNLEQYFHYIDQASYLIPRQVLDKPKNLTRDQILQSISYFYFLVDQPLPELKDKGLFRNSIQYYPPFSAWLRDFAKTWGDFLDTPASWNAQNYREFRADPRFGLMKGWYEPATNWNTFNRFFSRYLISEDARPIAAPDDPSVVVSPADSVPQGVWAIDQESNIRVDGGLKVKFVTYYNVNDLLTKDSQFKNAFAGGVLTHTFLNVNDYHRYHFAVAGTVLEKKRIAQNVSLEVKWSPEQAEYVPIDSTGWQFTQTRGYVIVDSGKYGLVALIPMGMAQVSSVNFERDIQLGRRIRKGHMLGTFLFGGSDFVMLFQQQAGFRLTAEPEADSGRGERTYKHVLMGEQYGVMDGQK